MSISILGSTGSIGTNTLKVAEHLGLPITALAVCTNIDLLEKQIQRHHPDFVCVFDPIQARALRKRLPHFPVLEGMEGLKTVAASGDTLVAAISGTQSIEPTFEAVRLGKKIALANKETLVSAGELFTTCARHTNSILIPVDSEHSAIFQCLQGHTHPKKLILTASGGPFLHTPQETLNHISLTDALSHPNYAMGIKNTIDSSTLMNKGLEVIEAHWLFGIPDHAIEVVIHPEQVLHSMVEYIDGSILAQLSSPTMLLPIQYALTYPERKPGLLPPFDWTQYPTLHFLPPDTKKFPCLHLAYTALQEKGSLPCYLNAANEILVQRFVKNHISWIDIQKKLTILLEKHKKTEPQTIEEIMDIDKTARHDATTI